MRYVNYGLIVLALLTIVLPAVVLAAAWVLWGFGSAVAWAAAWIAIWTIILLLVPLALYLLTAWKGLPWVTGKTRGLFVRVEAASDRANMLAQRGGRAAIEPDLWLYEKAAWLRGFWNGVRRNWSLAGTREAKK